MRTRAWDVVTFDCYGTLVDWEGGILGAFAAEAKRRGEAVPDADRIISLYHEIEPHVEAGPFRRYREVLEETAARIVARLGWEAGDPSFLPESLPDWPPFPDTGEALETLAARGYRLGILSNVDRDLIARTREHLPAAFDFVITAEDVRAYKPATPHFEAARERVAGARWLHAAQSWFHDIVPARRMGVPTVWVNRKAERLGADARPDGVVADVAGLVEWLAATES